jgi:hypothetical protein
VEEATTLPAASLKAGDRAASTNLSATARGLTLCTVANRFEPRFRFNRWRSEDGRYETRAGMLPR